MKTLQPLILIALGITLAAWLSLQGVSEATYQKPAPLVEEPPATKVTEPVHVTHTAAPIRQTTPAHPSEPKAPSPLQIALQAGDFCETVKLLEVGAIPQPEVWSAILSAIQPSSALSELYGEKGPMLAASVPGNDDPKAGTIKYSHPASRLLWALKMGGTLYSPVSPAGDNARAARAVLLELQKKEPGNAVYPLFRLVQEEKLGYTKEQLKATAEEIAGASSFDTHLEELDREIREAQWLNPAVHYAINYSYSSWGPIAFDNPINILRRMATEGTFSGTRNLARLMTDQGIHASRSSSSGEYSPSQYSAGVSLEPFTYKKHWDLDREKGGKEIYAPGSYTLNEQGERMCNVSGYETFFYEARDSR